ncbi:MAG: ABC-F family ATP-binding cassette domain-containing protein [Clostridia bacterium]|nr:ABC-F family ATP-binding cassette domain-containing protein [Clostridia bacterium]
MDKVTFEIQEGQKVALIGRNGCGKTTLFKCITGEEQYDLGQLIVHPSKRIGVLTQLPKFPQGTTVRNVLETAFREQRKMGKELEEIAAKLAEGDSDPALLRRYGELQHLYEIRGGYTEEPEMFRVSLGLGVPREMWDMEYGALSGGEMTRVNLACLLLEKTDIMLLDEPTNHLDMQSLDWLENYLKSYHGTVLVISHDRYFLDRVTTRTIELENMHTRVYEGNYSFFADRRAAEEEEQQKRFEQMQKEIDRLQHTSDRMHGWGSGNKKMMHKAFALDKRIERIKANQPDRVRHEKKLNGRLREADRSGNDVLYTEALTKSFGERTLFSDLELEIKKDEAIAIIGENGSGKSTLLKILLGEEPQSSGRYKWGTNIKLAYLPQKVTFKDESMTVLDEVVTELGINEPEARNRLGTYRFRGDDVFKSISVLSGGEKSRLKLCIMLYDEINTLVLDEPTNHLDIYSREWLEDLLDSYESTLIFVSHARYCIDRFATHIWSVENGGVRDYKGVYSAYRDLLEREANQPKIQPPRDEPKPQKRERNMSPDKYLRKLERELALIEQQISETEARAEAISSEMEEKCTDHVELERLSVELDAVNSETETLYEKWNELSEEIEEAKASEN